MLALRPQAETDTGDGAANHPHDGAGGEAGIAAAARKFERHPGEAGDPHRNDC